jgi:uncharacterized protein YlbG (UPF0298 family)
MNNLLKLKFVRQIKAILYIKLESNFTDATNMLK